MTGYLANILGRASGDLPVVAARPRSRFEPDPVADGPWPMVGDDDGVARPGADGPWSGADGWGARPGAGALGPSEVADAGVGGAAEAGDSLADAEAGSDRGPYAAVPQARSDPSERGPADVRVSAPPIGILHEEGGRDLGAAYRPAAAPLPSITASSPGVPESVPGAGAQARLVPGEAGDDGPGDGGPGAADRPGDPDPAARGSDKTSPGIGRSGARRSAQAPDRAPDRAHGESRAGATATQATARQPRSHRGARNVPDLIQNAHPDRILAGAPATGSAEEQQGGRRVTVTIGRVEVRAPQPPLPPPSLPEPPAPPPRPGPETLSLAAYLDSRARGER